MKRSLTAATAILQHDLSVEHHVTDVTYLTQHFTLRCGQNVVCATRNDFIGVGARLDKTGAISSRVNRPTQEIRP